MDDGTDHPRDGEDLYYEHSWPDGDDVPAVVLTHGAGGTHVAWFQQVPALVDAGYQVLTWDSRGFGNSTNRGTLTTEAVAADLEALMDHVGIAAPTSSGSPWAVGTSPSWRSVTPSGLARCRCATRPAGCSPTSCGGPWPTSPPGVA